MNNKIINVYYGVDCLPYKDSAREVHYPIVGGVFLGASDTTVIRFYYDYIGSSNNTYVSETKLPNGKTGCQILSKGSDDDGHYVELSLSSWYTQAKGDIYISLKGYAGGVQVEYDEETEIYEVVGTPTIQATGAIKLSVNYTPMGSIGDYDDIFNHYQEIMAAIAQKLDKNSPNFVKVVEQGTSTYSTDDYNDGDLIIEKGYNILQKLSYGTSGLSPDSSIISVGELNIYDDVESIDTEKCSFKYSSNYIDIKPYQYTFRLDGNTNNIYIINDYGEIDDTFVKLSYLTTNYYNKTQVEELIADVFEMTSSPMVLTNTQYNELANNPNKVIEYNGGYYVLVNEYTDYATYKKVVSVSNVSGVNTFVSDYITLNKTLKTLTSYSSTYTSYSYDKANDTFYSKTYIDSNYLTEDEIGRLIESVKANEFITVDITEYPTLNDFLTDFDEQEEGHIYLYPIDTTDLTKGYYQYIWEGSSWVSLGTTQIDLSNYYTKSETYSQTEVNNTFVSQTRTIAGSPLSSNISASAIQSALFDITVVEVVERD